MKITKFVSWIGVGACHINKIKEANFNFYYSNTGHGSYLISSNGYSWSSYKPEYNSKYEPFQFKTGDIIHLEFSLKERMLRFKKESTDQTYSLEVEINGDPETYTESKNTMIQQHTEIGHFVQQNVK